MANSVIKLAITDDIYLINIGKISNKCRDLADILTGLNEINIDYSIISQSPMIKCEMLNILIKISICDFCKFLKQIGKIKKTYPNLSVEVISESTEFSFQTDSRDVFTDLLNLFNETGISLRAFHLYGNNLDIYVAESFSDKILNALPEKYEIEII